MNGLSRALRLDLGTWRWLESEASLAGAGLVVLGGYLMFALDRFGWPDFSPRATVRLMLTGFYGWMWLGVALWVLVRLASGSFGPLAPFVRLVGHAHLPLLLVAIFIQVVSVMLRLPSLARWPALFAGVFWMPAMLAGAVAASADVRLPRALLIVTVPYLVWVAVVGRILWRQLGHLL